MLYRERQEIEILKEQHESAINRFKHAELKTALTITRLKKRVDELSNQNMELQDEVVFLENEVQKLSLLQTESLSKLSAAQQQQNQSVSAAPVKTCSTLHVSRSSASSSSSSLARQASIVPPPILSSKQQPKLPSKQQHHHQNSQSTQPSFLEHNNTELSTADSVYLKRAREALDVLQCTLKMESVPFEVNFLFSILLCHLFALHLFHSLSLSLSLSCNLTLL
jgi:hypothetical protein